MAGLPEFLSLSEMKEDDSAVKQQMRSYLEYTKIPENKPEPFISYLEEIKTLRIKNTELISQLKTKDKLINEAEEIMKAYSASNFKYKKDKCATEEKHLEEKSQFENLLRKNQSSIANFDEEHKQALIFIHELKVLFGFPVVKNNSFLEELKQIVEIIKIRMAVPSSSTVNAETSADNQILEGHMVQYAAPPSSEDKLLSSPCAHIKRLPDPLKKVTNSIAKRKQQPPNWKDAHKIVRRNENHYVCSCGLTFLFELHLEFHVMQAQRNRSSQCLSHSKRSYPSTQFQRRKNGSLLHSLKPPNATVATVERSQDISVIHDDGIEEVEVGTLDTPFMEGNNATDLTSNSSSSSSLHSHSPSPQQSPVYVTSAGEICNHTTEDSLASCGTSDEHFENEKGEHTGLKMNSSNTLQEEEMEMEQENSEIAVVSSDPISCLVSDEEKSDVAAITEIDRSHSPEALIPENFDDANPYKTHKELPPPQLVANSIPHSSQVSTQNGNDLLHRVDPEGVNKCSCGLIYAKAELLQQHIATRNRGKFR